jgi:hypothetical protein
MNIRKSNNVLRIIFYFEKDHYLRKMINIYTSSDDKQYLINFLKDKSTALDLEYYLILSMIMYIL